ncbi:PREDICTED: uncharacterized protein LOC105562743 [Vollenhovia emeryi]|uniref:uncharacterized protein LOC105562743 n=1 Tax=Vollenhovia emeryi TaxID=411798 RepID=UPI0005F48EE9|nr:PREDICTED: uncharacterized protein LOC105562743 [Vollenhovia emeryi]
MEFAIAPPTPMITTTTDDHNTLDMDNSMFIQSARRREENINDRLYDYAQIVVPSIAIPQTEILRVCKSSNSGSSNTMPMQFCIIEYDTVTIDVQYYTFSNGGKPVPENVSPQQPNLVYSNKKMLCRLKEENIPSFIMSAYWRRSSSGRGTGKCVMPLKSNLPQEMHQKAIDVMDFTLNILKFEDSTRQKVSPSDFFYYGHSLYIFYRSTSAVFGVCGHQYRPDKITFMLCAALSSHNDNYLVPCGKVTFTNSTKHKLVLFYLIYFIYRMRVIAIFTVKGHPVAEPELIPRTP